MSCQNPFKYFNSPPDIIRLAVMFYVRYSLSFRQVEDILSERGIDVSHETIHFWVARFAPKFASTIRAKRRGSFSHWRWHLDEAYVKINGRKLLLWRAIDREGEVLDAFVSTKRCKRTALKFMRKLMRGYGRPREVVTDKLPSYGAALKVLGASDLQNTEQYLNNRCENSHQPFRRRERAMQKFKCPSTLQQFASYHGQIYNHFNHERHFLSKKFYKLKRGAALQEWIQLCA